MALPSHSVLLGQADPRGSSDPQRVERGDGGGGGVCASGLAEVLTVRSDSVHVLAYSEGRKEVHAFERWVRRDSIKAAMCHLHPFVQRHPWGFKGQGRPQGLPWDCSLVRRGRRPWNLPSFPPSLAQPGTCSCLGPRKAREGPGVGRRGYLKAGLWQRANCQVRALA